MKGVIRGPAKYPLMVSLAVILLFIAGWWLLQGSYMPVLTPSGQVAEKERNLIVFTVMLAVIVVVPVFAMLALFSWKYRDATKKARYEPEWDKNTRLELIWWGIPIAIIGLLSVVTYITSHSLDPYKPIESDGEPLVVQVVALQWKWLFIYPDQGVATVNDLTIPAHRPVHFHLSADAPMSAFWIPALGGQIYSMNAMSSQLHLIADHEGTFKGYNTNINGEGYAKMTFDVHAVSDGAFADWQTKHASSGHVLNAMHFEELAKPSMISEPMYMRLESKDLYTSVVMKYMQEHSSAEAADHDATMNTMNHSGMEQ